MKTILKIVCMWCGREMGEKDGEGVEGTSHSICEACWYEHYPELGQYPDKPAEKGIWLSLGDLDSD